jgi:hypothetical protein
MDEHDQVGGYPIGKTQGRVSEYMWNICGRPRSMNDTTCLPWHRSMIALNLGKELQPTFLQNASYIATVLIQHDDRLRPQFVEYLIKKLQGRVG